MGEQTHPVGYEFGEFRVDIRQRALLVRADGRSLPIHSRAFDLLQFFLEHPGELLDKSALLKAVWPNVVVEENNLNQHISALRRVLGERPEEHRFIVTIPGRGYRFVAPVRPTGETSGTAGASLAPESAARPSPRAWWWTLPAAAILLAAGVAWYLEHFMSRPTLPAATPVTSIEVVPIRKPRLAVLPFENLSPDPNNAFFADGLHEEILSTIAQRVSGVEVISRTTMMGYRTNPPKPLAVVARELQATHLIEGSVRREGNRIRLTLQLIDARTDGHIWSANYDRTLADTLNLETQVAQEVAAQLPIELVRAEHPAAAPIQDTEGFDLYLKAVLALRNYRNEGGEQYAAIESLLDRVITRLPTFALAYAQRARLHTLAFIASFNTSEAFVANIRKDLDTARRLAPADPNVLAATGFLLMCENETTGALAAYDAAEAAGLAEPEWFTPKAQLLLRRSRIEELKSTTQRMLALDPANPIVINFAVFHLMDAQQPMEAWRAADYSRAFPQMNQDLRAWILLAFTGRTQEAHSYFENYGAADPGQPYSITDYAALLRFEHRYPELKALLDRIPVESAIYFNGVEFGPVGPTPTALLRGWADLLLGDRAAALRDGRAILSFVERQPRTRWNQYYLELLSAEGLAFTRECKRANEAARSSLALLSRADNAVIWNTAGTFVAQVDAWCGEHAEAVELLQQLTAGRPGIAPGLIARDPLYTVPLAQFPEYQALKARLESEMRATQLALGVN